MRAINGILICSHIENDAITRICIVHTLALKGKKSVESFLLLLIP